MTPFDLNTIPDQLSDADMRALLASNSNNIRELSENIVRNNVLAEQGLIKEKAIKLEALELFKTDDIDEIAKILNNRLELNAQNARQYFLQYNSTVEAINALSPNAMTARAPGR